MQCNDNYSWMSHTYALSVLFLLVHRDCDPFPSDQPRPRLHSMYKHQSESVLFQSVSVSDHPPLRMILSHGHGTGSVRGGDHHWRPTALVQWYIGPVAQRACVAAFDLVCLPCFDWPDGLRPVAHSLALALALAFALREANPFQRQDSLYPNVFME